MVWPDERYGGMGDPDFRFEQIIIEELVSHGDPGFGLTLHSRLVGPYLGMLGTPEQKERFLPGCVRGETILGIAMSEPAAGSDVSPCGGTPIADTMKNAKTYFKAFCRVFIRLPCSP